MSWSGSVFENAGTFRSLDLFVHEDLYTVCSQCNPSKYTSQLRFTLFCNRVLLFFTHKIVLAQRLQYGLATLTPYVARQKPLVRSTFHLCVIFITEQSPGSGFQRFSKLIPSTNPLIGRLKARLLKYVNCPANTLTTLNLCFRHGCK